MFFGIRFEAEYQILDLTINLRLVHRVQIRTFLIWFTKGVTESDKFSSRMNHIDWTCSYLRQYEHGVSILGETPGQRKDCITILLNLETGN